MSSYLLESRKGHPAPTTAALDPDKGSPDRPVTKPLAWDGDVLLEFTYSACLVLVSARGATTVQFQVIDCATGVLVKNADGVAPIFTLGLEDYEPVYCTQPSTLPAAENRQYPKVSILMLVLGHVKDSELKAILSRANVPLGKWPRGEDDSTLRAKLLAQILRQPGVWRLLGEELQAAIRGLGLGPLVHLP
jgi:hypothetical protein